MFGIKKLILLVLLLFVVQMSNVHLVLAQVPLDFNVDVQTGCSPLVTSFNTDTSSYNSFLWNFGDGSFSTHSFPQHVYINPGSYTVSLIGISNTGITDTVVKQNLIIINNKPTANFSISSNVVCEQGEEIIFTNQSSNYITCFWDFGDGTSSYSNNPTHSFGASGTYSISLIVFDANGCFNSKELINGIIVNPKPSGIISSSSYSSCDINENFNFSFSSTSISNYQWQFGDGSSSSLASPVHSYGQSGLFNVELITQNVFGCHDTTYLTNGIEIKDNPKPDMVLSDSVICAPGDIYISTTAVNISSLNWYDSNGFNNPIAVTSYSVAGVDTLTLNLSVLYQNGCSNSNSKVIIGLATPDPVYGIIDAFGCAPHYVQLVNATVGNYIWNWDFGDSTSASNHSPSHTYTQAGTYLPKLTAIDVNGCSKSWITPGLIQIVKPEASFTSNITSGCEPTEIEFMSTSSGVTQYNWFFGDGNISTSGNPVNTYNQAGNYDVELVVTDNQGCADTIKVDNYISIGIDNIQYNSQTIFGCAPFSVQFSSPNTFGNHLWSFGDGSNSTNSNPTHTFTNPGIYTVSYNFSSTNTHECSQSIANYATYIIGGGEAFYSVEQTVCPPYTASFTDSSINAISWYWDFGDGNVSTNQNPSHVYTNPGNYNVSLTITTSDGCQRTITKNYVVNFEPLLASPDANALNSTLPTDVQFLANSTGATNWFWDFGDGSTSNMQNPLHTYTIPGPFSISLIISNDTCSRTLNFPNVSLGGGSNPLPGDSIIYSQSEPFSGCVPYSVEFNSPVKNAVYYTWYFGNGDSSNLANPKYVYQVPGNYDVMLVTEDTLGTIDTLIMPGEVKLYGLSANYLTQNNFICGNDSVIVTALDTNAINYLWDFGDGSTTSGMVSSHTYSQADDYFISLRVSDSLGCEILSNQLYSSGLRINLSSNKKNACVNDSISFNANYNPLFNYEWDFGDGNYSSDISPLHGYSAGGNYLVSLTLTDSFGCIIPISKTLEIIVHEPKADFSYSVVQNYCNQIAYQFTNTSQNDLTWYWNFGDGVTSNLENPGHNYTNFGIFDISLTVSKYNCVSTKTDSSAIVFNELIPDFNYTQIDKCLPLNIEFENLSQNAINYLWQFGDGNTSNLYEPTHTFNTAPFDSIYLIVNDGTGCVKSTSKPIIQFISNDFICDISEGCSPLSVQFTNNSVGYDSLKWILNDSIYSTIQNPSFVIIDEGYYDVSLILYSSLGCVDTLKKDSLIYVSNPIVEFSTVDSIVCKPAIVSFMNLSSNVDKYIWSFGDGSSSLGESPEHIYNNTGQYLTSLIGVSTIGCRDTFRLSYPLKIQGPEAKFFLASTHVCEPKNIWFNDSSSFANFWFWDFGDGYTSTEKQPIHHYAEPGIYNASLIVTDSFGCSSIFVYPNGVHISDHTEIGYSLDKTNGCAPLQIQLSFPISLSDSILVDFGDGIIGNKNTVLHEYLNPGEYQIKFIRISEWGCVDTSYSDTIKVIQSPKANFTIENGIGCLPLECKIIDLSRNLYHPSYLWNIGANYYYDTSSFNVNINNSGSYNISLIVVNDSMCSDTFIRMDAIQAFENNLPKEVGFDYLTVTDIDSVELQWQKNLFPDINYYNLYRLNFRSGLYDKIYSTDNAIKNNNNSVINYYDRDLNTNNYKYLYKLQAVNYCDAKIPIDDIAPYNSILLKIDSVSTNGIYLSWNKYLECPVSGYEIYRSKLSSGPFTYLNTVDADNSAYVDSGFDCPQPFMYFVKAVNLCSSSYFSKSNKVIAEPLNNLSDQKVSIIRSTVVDDSFILTEWSEPELFPELVIEYMVYRSEDSLNFNFIERVPGYVTSFIDTDVKVDYQNYFYKIIPFNVCDVNAKESNLSSSILLNSQMDNETAKLKWSKYTEWKSGVEKYVIERMDFNGNWQVIKIVDGKTLQAED